MQNDWTMNIKQNLMSHTRITNDKFHTTKNSIMAEQNGPAITEGCFRVRFRTTFSSFLMFSRNHGNVLPNWSIVLQLYYYSLLLLSVFVSCCKEGHISLNEIELFYTS